MHSVFLAISAEAYERAQNVPALFEWIDEREINLLIVDLTQENITQWIQY